MSLKEECWEWLSVLQWVLSRVTGMAQSMAKAKADYWEHMKAEQSEECWDQMTATPWD